MDRTPFSGDNRAIALTVFECVGNALGVSISHLSPSDSFERELALTQFQFLEYFCQVLDVDWSILEEAIDETLNRKLGNGRTETVLKGSIEDVIHTLIR